MDIITKTSHEDLFLEQGHLLLIQFKEGFVPLRIVGMEWSNAEPVSLGPVAALSNLATYTDLQDSAARRLLEPYDEQIIYQTFFGVTPANARVYVQYPPRTDLGSMQNIPRIITGDIGFIDGRKSPFYGPFSRVTEIVTVKERYPQFQAYNPTYDAMANVMVSFDQRQYTYSIVKDTALIKKMVLGEVPRKIVTIGVAYPDPATIPDWLRKAATPEILIYTRSVAFGGIS
jgi:hypothetical protein